MFFKIKLFKDEIKYLGPGILDYLFLNQATIFDGSYIILQNCFFHILTQTEIPGSVEIIYITYIILHYRFSGFRWEM